MQGQKGVGKTSLLTRLLTDEFIDSPNFIFEGEQSLLLSLREKTFRIIL